MSFVSDLAKKLGFGPDRWDERLGENLILNSPEGNEFEAKWRGSPRSKEKKLGIYSYPKVVGNVVQDKSMQSARYPLSFYFDGKDNDITSNDFFRACDEDGTWKITHPVHGFYELQLISVTENCDPAENGNLTYFETEWIEPIDEVTLLTGRQMAGTIDASIADLNTNAAIQFAENVKSASETMKANIEDATNLLDDMTEYAMKPLFTTTAALSTAFKSIQTGIQATIRATSYKFESLAGQLQNLVQICAISTSDVNARLNPYNTLKTSVLNALSATAGKYDEEAMNNAVMQELALSSVVAAFAKMAITAKFESKIQALDFSDTVLSTIAEITQALDAAQEDFVDNDIDLQFFSQTQSYSLAERLVGQVARYLLITAFNLKIEKRFTLSKPTCPIDIAISQYGELGDNDENFDLFISSNQLKNGDIMILPAGREVVIYA